MITCKPISILLPPIIMMLKSVLQVKQELSLPYLLSGVELASFYILTTRSLVSRFNLISSYLKGVKNCMK